MLHDNESFKVRLVLTFNKSSLKKAYLVTDKLSPSFYCSFFISSLNTTAYSAS